MPFKLLTHFRAFSLKYSLSWRPHAELMTGTLTVRDSLSFIQRVINQSAQINQILSSPVFYLKKATFERPAAAEVMLTEIKYLVLCRSCIAHASYQLTQTFIHTIKTNYRDFQSRIGSL